MNKNSRQARRRKGVTILLAALLLVFMLGMVAFAIDIGYIVLVRTQLQAAADSAAMAAAASMGLPREQMEAVARQYAAYHSAGGSNSPVMLSSADIQYGTWDASIRRFVPSQEPGNAIRVTARTDELINSRPRLFFARILGRDSFTQRASAVAMANPRDIAFVVDLSGSMNDDSEPCWATDAINNTFGPRGYPSIGSQLMQQVYEDFGFGSFPGTLQYLGEPLGVRKDSYAYAELTKNGGPLSGTSIPTKYRIANTDSEAVRKQKAYSWIIDHQIAKLMPNARPVPNSDSNYAYWAAYLDYIIIPVTISGGSVGTPPSNRGSIPPSRYSEQITGCNNPNRDTFPQASSSIPQGFRNRIGYRTYVQFMMDHGRDLRPDGKTYVPLSRFSPDCPWHSEETPGGVFRFPPREQPTHAARRSLIAAIQVVKERNASITNPQQRDWVSIITFDKLSGGGPVVVQPLTADYDQAMAACVNLQAVGDVGASTATEAGLIAARNHLRPTSQGGAGRYSTNKYVILLTDGVPNLYVSSTAQINDFISRSGSQDFYSANRPAYNASIMQAMLMKSDKWYVFPVALGLGCDYDFMDRMARAGNTADDDGRSVRGTGNPAEYEQRLIDIFQHIITNPKVRLVQ
jgi:Flp pilus assembly protein TadG